MVYAATAIAVLTPKKPRITLASSFSVVVRIQALCDQLLFSVLSKPNTPGVYLFCVKKFLYENKSY